MIDTKETNQAEIRAAIALLQGLLPANDPAPDYGLKPSHPDFGPSRGMDTPDPLPSAPLPPPPPPPPPVVMTPTSVSASTPIPADSDPDVELDETGAVASVTTSVSLPSAPPPPALAGNSVPTAIPAPPGPAVAAELDKAGYPWDGRIHASNRSKKLDGRWKNKRGVDPNLIIQIEALTKPVAAPLAAPAVTTVPTVAATAPAAPPPPAPTVGTVAPAAAAPSAIDFRGLMAKIAGNTTAGKLSTDQVNAALASVGLKPEEMGALVGNAPLIASVNKAIDAALGA